MKKIKLKPIHVFNPQELLTMNIYLSHLQNLTNILLDCDPLNGMQQYKIDT